LDNQDSAADLTVLVLVNNSTDDSTTIARRFAASSRARVLVEDIALPDPDANAGGARRIAIQKAADIAGAGGIVLTTDADGRVAPNWLRENLRAIDAGADAVAGRAIIDPVEEALIPAALIEADARECKYAALLDEIVAQLDPDPADPWPRHDEHSGASIAVTVGAMRRAGGIPCLAMGEDRAFFRALRRIDAKIRHSPDVQVVVSGRTEGRAKGGMADTIRRRMVCPDMFLTGWKRCRRRSCARGCAARRGWPGRMVVPISGRSGRWREICTCRRASWARRSVRAGSGARGTIWKPPAPRCGAARFPRPRLGRRLRRQA
jgi:GT2 family glycosyltransferase